MFTKKVVPRGSPNEQSGSLRFPTVPPRRGSRKQWLPAVPRGSPRRGARKKWFPTIPRSLSLRGLRTHGSPWFPAATRGGAPPQRITKNRAARRRKDRAEDSTRPTKKGGPTVPYTHGSARLPAAGITEESVAPLLPTCVFLLSVCVCFPVVHPGDCGLLIRVSCMCLFHSDRSRPHPASRRESGRPRMPRGKLHYDSFYRSTHSCSFRAGPTKKGPNSGGPNIEKNIQTHRQCTGLMSK